MENQDALKLLSWYDEFGRSLPWREKVTPYHVWLSEVMLQQTRVETVKGYYTRFLTTLPTIQSIALCEEDVYLKLWQGLGYYSRVRNLHKGAIFIMDEYDGIIPDEIDKLLKIPSIGEYTAKAILAIAFHKNYVAVDGNLLRVFARLTCYDQDIKDKEAKEKCNDFFYPFLNDKPGDFNQALMDLGEMICLPNGEPKCHLCPLKNCCLSYKEGKQADFPITPKKTNRKLVDKTVLVIHYQDKYLIQKRPDKGLLASLYEFVNIDQKMTQEEVMSYLSRHGFKVKEIKYLHSSKHVFTHLIWQMEGYDIELDTLPKEKGLLFVSKEDLRNIYSIPSAFSYFLKMVLL